jgi:hypothetical protein
MLETANFGPSKLAQEILRFVKQVGGERYWDANLRRLIPDRASAIKASATVCGRAGAGTDSSRYAKRKEVFAMAKDHGPSVKDDKQYEGLRKKGMSKERAAKIANTKGASKKGGKKSSS